MAESPSGVNNRVQTRSTLPIGANEYLFFVSVLFSTTKVVSRDEPMRLACNKVERVL